MNKLIRCLAILTASALLSVSLLSCGSEDDTDAPTVTDTTVTYEGLTPKEVYETLLKTDDFVFITVMDRNVTDAKISMTYMLEKDGDTLRYTVHQDAEDDVYDTSTVIYIDLAKSICIAPSGEDEWYVLEDSEKFSIEALIKNCTPAELLFDTDHYTQSGGKYVLTEEAIHELIGSTSATVSGKMASDGGNYTFDVVTKEAGNTVTMTTKILFRNVSVEMPTYDFNSPGQSGTAAPDTDKAATDEAATDEAATDESAA